MGRNAWIILVAVIIIAGGAWYFYGAGNVADTVPAADAPATEAPATEAPAADAPAAGGTAGN